jgi:hypothetical protein
MNFSLMFVSCASNYRGDKAFCSIECRENFMGEEMEGEPVMYHPAPPCGSHFDGGRIFQLIR